MVLLHPPPHALRYRHFSSPAALRVHSFILHCACSLGYAKGRRCLTQEWAPKSCALKRLRTVDVKSTDHAIQYNAEYSAVWYLYLQLLLVILKQHIVARFYRPQ